MSAWPVFLDRDGVINRFPGKGVYVTRLEDFELLPRAARAVARLSQAGFDVFVISNQGCVSRGLITLEGLEAITERMRRGIEAEGGRLAGVHYCVHQTRDACDCKKPKTALFRKAVEGRPVDWASTCFVGDSLEDVQAGRALGCRSVLVLSGRTSAADVATMPVQPDLVKPDLWEAVEWIVRTAS